MQMALSVAPTSFTNDEVVLANRLVEGLKYMSTIINYWFPDYNTAAREKTIQLVNEMTTSILAGTSKEQVMALMVKCYETLNSQARAHVDIATEMPLVLVDLVIAYTSVAQWLPTQEYIDIFTYFWDYITGLGPALQVSFPNRSSGPRNIDQGTGDLTAHPISDIDWTPRPAYGVAVALMLKKYFNFDGRFSYKGNPYNVDRAKLIKAYETSAKVILNNNERAGLTSLIYTFKRPDWNAPDDEYANMVLAAKTKDNDVITPLGSATEHVLYLGHAKISNYMPFREWFDVCNRNGDSVWQFQEGNNTTDVSDAIYMIKMSGTPFYPTDTISLGANDSAKVTNINGVVLTGIIKDGAPYPDIQFSSQPVY